MCKSLQSYTYLIRYPLINETTSLVRPWACHYWTPGIFYKETTIFLAHTWHWYLEIKADNINRDDGLPGIVLQSSREEGLREEEAGYPEDRRYTLINPCLDELHPLHQVQHPGCQGLEGGVCLDRELWGKLYAGTHLGRVRDIYYFVEPAKSLL